MFVGWIPSNLRWQDLKEIFAEYWEVVFAKVIIDRETRRSRFWFVEFADPEVAVKAKEEMDWAEIDWRRIKVDFAREWWERPSNRDNW